MRVLWALSVRETCTNHPKPKGHYGGVGRGMVKIVVGSKRPHHGFKLRSAFIPEKRQGIQMGGEREESIEMLVRSESEIWSVSKLIF